MKFSKCVKYRVFLGLWSIKVKEDQFRYGQNILGWYLYQQLHAPRIDWYCLIQEDASATLFIS